MSLTLYYQDESVTLYHGDFREATVSFDAVITDPPYGETSLAWDRWPDNWPAHLARLAPPACSLWFFGSMRMMLRQGSQFGDWQFSQELVWEKHNGSGFHADRFKRVHEHIFHFYRGSWTSLYKQPVFTPDATARTVRRKKRPTHMGHIEQGAYASVDGGPRLMRSVLYARSCHGEAVNETQKPLELLYPLIEYSVPPKGMVFDPFAGSGSALVAAVHLGRKAVGCEIREEQCEAIVRRLSQRLLLGQGDAA
jgi:site-specific DNA-methyltransferase (adenine-specific)